MTGLPKRVLVRAAQRKWRYSDRQFGELISGQVAVGRNRNAVSKPAWKREGSGVEEGISII